MEVTCAELSTGLVARSGDAQELRGRKPAVEAEVQLRSPRGGEFEVGARIDTPQGSCALRLRSSGERTTPGVPPGRPSVRLEPGQEKVIQMVEQPRSIDQPVSPCRVPPGAHVLRVELRVAPWTPSEPGLDRAAPRRLEIPVVVE